MWKAIRNKQRVAYCEGLIKAAEFFEGRCILDDVARNKINDLIDKIEKEYEN